MKKFLIGCGIAVGVVTLIGIGSSVWLFFSLKKSMPDTERAERFQEELIATYGPAAEYVPPTGDAFLEPEHLARYLQVRAALADQRAAAAAALDDLTAQFGDEFEEKSAWQKTKTVFGSIRGGMNLAHEIVDYVAARDSLLLDHGVGLGEFSYVNTLVVFAWLDWDPESNLQEEARGELEDVQEVAKDTIRTADRLFRQQLENLADALEEVSAPTEAQRARMETVQDVLASRRRRGTFPLEGRLDAASVALLTQHDHELRGWLPTTLGQAMVEAANFDTVDDDDSNVQITID